MRVAIGLLAHSGWAALVAVGEPGRETMVADRRRIELVDEAWEKHAYHAAEGLPATEASALVDRAIASARRLAAREIDAALERMSARGDQVVACAVLVGEPTPDWSVAEAIAVHVRMHQAEGRMFRDALVHGAEARSVRVVAIRAKELWDRAERVLAMPRVELERRLGDLRGQVGAPWGKDQKDAALAGLVALREPRTRPSGQ